MLKGEQTWMEFMVLWDDLHPKETLWEALSHLSTTFPSLNLEDKVSLNKYGDDTCVHPRSMAI